MLSGTVNYSTTEGGLRLRMLFQMANGLAPALDNQSVEVSAGNGTQILRAGVKETVITEFVSAQLDKDGTEPRVKDQKPCRIEWR